MKQFPKPLSRQVYKRNLDWEQSEVELPEYIWQSLSRLSSESQVSLNELSLRWSVSLQEAATIADYLSENGLMEQLCLSDLSYSEWCKPANEVESSPQSVTEQASSSRSDSSLNDVEIVTDVQIDPIDLEFDLVS